MARKFRAPKDKFASLNREWKDAVDNMNRDDIRQRIATVTMEYTELLEAKKNDVDLQEKQEAYKNASEVYRRGTKDFKLKVEYLKKAMDAQGGDTHKDAATSAVELP